MPVSVQTARASEDYTLSAPVPYRGEVYPTTYGDEDGTARRRMYPGRILLKRVGLLISLGSNRY